MELNAYYLAILTLDDHVLHKIDLDERGWMKTHAALMRRVAEWHLVRHGDQVVVLSLMVREGQQPFYFSRVFKNSISDDVAIRSWVLGSKTLATDDQPERLTQGWVLETGQHGSGDEDLDYFGHQALRDKIQGLIDSGAIIVNSGEPDPNTMG